MFLFAQEGKHQIFYTENIFMDLYTDYIMNNLLHFHYLEERIIDEFYLLKDNFVLVRFIFTFPKIP